MDDIIGKLRVDHDEDIDVRTLEEQLMQEKTQLLAAQWREGELYVCKDYVQIYEEPKDPSPVVTEFQPGTILLLCNMEQSTYRGGFRDVLLPIRGWIWTEIDEYDKAFYEASAQMQNRNTFAEFSVSIMVHTITPCACVFLFYNRVSSTSLMARSQRKLHHIQQKAAKWKNERSVGRLSSISTTDGTKISTNKSGSFVIHPNLLQTNVSLEMSASDLSTSKSKWHRMSNQISFYPAQISKIVDPLPPPKKASKKTSSNISTSDIQSHMEMHNALSKEQLPSTAEEEDTTEEEDEQKSLLTTILNSRIVKSLIYFVRSHPALLTLIYIGICGFIEFLMFWDVSTDLLLCWQLSQSSHTILFTISVILIMAPYLLAYSSISGLIAKKRELLHMNRSKWKVYRHKIFVWLFSFPPAGILLLFLFDLWVMFELIIIRPVYFLCCCKCKLLRKDTFEELGYRKMRRVSDVCAETIFQAILQLWLLLVIESGSNVGGNVGSNSAIDLPTVIIAFVSGLFVIFLWFGVILRIECSIYGMSLYQYLPIVLLGSFNFVPYLPAIEKGTKNGKKVNWCLFKFDLNALSALGMAFNSPDCALTTVKITAKTVKKLPRVGCKYFGRLLASGLGHAVQVIISRLDTEIEDLFELFVVDQDRFFCFSDFCKAALALRAADNEILTYIEISNIFWELAQSTSIDEQKVWLLDLALKFRMSKTYVSLLDVDHPIDYCVKRNNVKLLTMCRAMGWQSENHEENVINSVTQNRLHIAHALTEDTGVPIVVEITEGRHLLLAYMKFHAERNAAQNEINLQAGFEFDENHLQVGNGISGSAPSSNLAAVQAYHELNKQRKSMINSTKKTNPYGMLDAMFEDINVKVSVSMCEIEKETSTSDEVLHQFWNERLLFVIPFSVIDEIVDNPILTLQRDTTQHTDISTCSHPRQLSIITDRLESGARYSLPPQQHSFGRSFRGYRTSNINMANIIHVRQLTSRQPTINLTPVIETPISSSAYETDDDYISDDNKLTVVGNRSSNRPSFSESAPLRTLNQDLIIADDNCHHNTQTMFVLTSLPEIDDGKMIEISMDSSEALDTPVHSADEDYLSSVDTFHVHFAKERTQTSSPKTKTPIPVGKPFLKNQTVSVDTAAVLLENYSPKFRPKLKRRESALRDAFQWSHISAFGRSNPLPVFEKKIYIDFTVSDDSNIINDEISSQPTSPRATPLGDGNEQQVDWNSVTEFQRGTSMSVINMNTALKHGTSASFSSRKINRTRTQSHHHRMLGKRSANDLKFTPKKNVIKFRKIPEDKKIVPKIESTEYDSDSQFDKMPISPILSSPIKIHVEDENSKDIAVDSERDGGCSPTGKRIRTRFKFNRKSDEIINAIKPKKRHSRSDSETANADQGTFLGSCSVSINIEDIEKLKTNHLTTIVKQITIGKKKNKNISSMNRSGDSVHDRIAAVSDIVNEESALDCGTIKIKIYCNALAAYLTYGENYGDQWIEHNDEVILNTVSVGCHTDVNAIQNALGHIKHVRSQKSGGSLSLRKKTK